MAERVQSFAVRIGEAVADRIRDHARTNPDQWYETPVDVQYGLRHRWQEAARPFVGVTVTGLEDLTGASAGDVGRGEYLVSVMAWTSDQSETERAAHEMASDIRRALTDEVAGLQLGGVLSSGRLWFSGYEAVVAPEIGEALSVLQFRAMCWMTETEA